MIVDTPDNKSNIANTSHERTPHIQHTASILFSLTGCSTNLRSPDCFCLYVKCVFVCQLCASFNWQLLHCAHKHIVNIMKVYNERNNCRVELIRFRKQISTLFTFTKPGFLRPTLCHTAYSLDGSNWPRATKLITI